jgi:hypothetical protein
MAAFLQCGLLIAPLLFELSAPVTGERERQFMSTKIKYTNEPIGEAQVLPDFLPSPSELAFREECVKVTLALSKKSVDFFKSEATRHQTQYQRMIRRLIDAYVDAQGQTGFSKGRAKKRRSA